MQTTEDRLRREIESERDELARAVSSLRGELDRKKRRAPVAAAGAIAAMAAVKLVARRLRRRC